MSQSLPSEPPPTASRHWLIAVVIAATVSHGLFFVYNQGPFTPDRPPSPDEAEYIALGQRLANEGRLELPTGEKAKRMPALPMLLAAAARLVDERNFRTAILAIQALLAAGSTVLAALLARRLATPRAGLVAGLASALYGPFLYLQSLCLTETLLIFLFTAALFVYVAAVSAPLRRSGSAFIGVGALLACAALTRANAAILLLPFLLDALCRTATRRERLQRVTILALPTVLALGAWTVRNQRELGEFTVSTIGGLNFYLGHNPHYADDPGLAHADYAAFDRIRRQTGESEVQVDRRLRDQAWAFVREHPGQALANTCSKMLVYHQPGTTQSAPTLFVLCFAVIAFAAPPALQDRAARRRRLIRLAAVVGLIVTSLFVLAEVAATFRPWVYPGHLLALGLVSMVLMRPRLRVRGLFIGLYLAEMLVAITFIPLVRLRWTIDGLLIVAIGVAVSNVCDYLQRSPAKEQGAFRDAQ